MTSPKKRFVSEQEHILMGRMADAMKLASSCAVEMVGLRPDQHDLWMKAGAMLKVLEGQLFDLSSQGLLTRDEGLFGGGKLS